MKKLILKFKSDSSTNEIHVAFGMSRRKCASWLADHGTGNIRLPIHKSLLSLLFKMKITFVSGKFYFK